MSNSQEDAFHVGPPERTHRFFFDVHDGAHVIKDGQGAQCSSLDEAAAQALVLAPKLLAQATPSEGRREFSVRVRDDHGVEVLRLSLTLNLERFGPF